MTKARPLARPCRRCHETCAPVVGRLQNGAHLVLRPEIIRTKYGCRPRMILCSSSRSTPDKWPHDLEYGARECAAGTCAADAACRNNAAEKCRACIDQTAQRGLKFVHLFRVVPDHRV